ncbi:MAG: hypothetical protein A2808_00845 [Candidatus Moranbacteria bacterium RIFCSPHIGHO2_01_FULL_55_24]|nr:MAG: hypothetical protein A2808_00845 [Candidatus Moranbacteria bacterium RIFCSPHIGHO2_01_FULL_55_24]
MKRLSRQSVPVRRAPKKEERVMLSGSVQTLFLLVLMALFISGGLYLFSVNRNAVQGYHLRNLENEIDTLKEENAELRIAEADLRSLYRIEASHEELQMEKTESLKYLEKHDSVALR